MQNQLDDIKKRIEDLEIENARLRREKVNRNRRPQHNNHLYPATRLEGRRENMMTRFDGQKGVEQVKATGSIEGLLLQPILPQDQVFRQPEDHTRLDEAAYMHYLRRRQRQHLLSRRDDHQQVRDQSSIAFRGRNIWVTSEHKALQVSYELLGAALPDAVRGFPVTIFAKYETNVNTAIKGIAIALDRLLREQQRYLAVEAFFRDNRNELSLRVIQIPQLAEIDFLDENTATSASQIPQLTVASATDFKILGGAIAMRIRDNEPALLRAIGKRAVWAAARALAIAREYILDDTTVSLRTVLFLPKFNSVQLPNRSVLSTVVELCVLSSLHLVKSQKILAQAATASPRGPQHDEHPLI